MKFIHFFRVLIINALVFIWSCDSAEKEKYPRATIEADIRTYVVENLKDLDFPITFDSIRLLELDTLTLSSKYFAMINDVSADIESMKEDFMKLQEEQESNLQMLRLTKGLSETLYDNYKAEFDQTQEKIMDMVDIEKGYEKKLDSLDSLFKTSDNTQLHSYQARYIYQYTRKDRTVKKDTGYLTLNKEFRIINKEDYLNN